MVFLVSPHIANIFGIFGSIVSFLVYLAPLPTFYRIYKKKSTEGFQAMPYSVALYSAMLYLYYAFVKTNSTVLLVINSIGCVIEGGYLVFFMIYATKESKVYTTKLLIMFNAGSFGAMVVFTYLFFKGRQRVEVVGWICSVFSVCVFAAPLSIMRQVIVTKSTEYMPLSLSFFLTFNAVMWFFYGFLIRDYYIATPNVLGFMFGVVQMVLYIIYRDRKGVVTVGEAKAEHAAVTDVELGHAPEAAEKKATENPGDAASITRTRRGDGGDNDASAA